MKNGLLIKGLVIVLLVFFLAGCAATKAYKRGVQAEREGDWDQAVLYYSEALKLSPDNLAYRLSLETARRQASKVHLNRAKQMMQEENVEQAMVEFRLALELDPANHLAIIEMDKARAQVEEEAERLREKTEIEKLKEKVETEKAPPVYLSPKSPDKISLSFPSNNMTEVYTALSKLSGINILLDPTIRDRKMSFEVTNVSFLDALDSLVTTNGHFYKIVNPTTIVVVPDNPAKRREYTEQVIQTFYLSNADVKNVLQGLRTVLGIRNISADPQLNSVTIRDSADIITLAEKLINRADKSKGEVIVDLEILEVNRTKLNEYGLLLSSYKITQGLAQEETGIRLSQIPYISQADWFLTIPSFTYILMKQTSDARLVAKPQLRITEGEKASLFIGEEIPIRVTTITPAQTIGVVTPIHSYQYRRVGIQIDLTPRVHHNNEITLALIVKIESILAEMLEGQPTFTSRTIESTIRLKDGETNLLAGLIRNEERKSLSGIPGLSDIPVLGKIFSKELTQNIETDIVLTMTPHIIKTPNITEEDLRAIWAGTERAMVYREAPPITELEERAVREEIEAAGEKPPEEKQAPAKKETEEETPPSEEPPPEEEEAEPEPEERGEELTPAEVSITPASLIVFQEERFSVNVNIDNARNVGHVPFNLSFNPDVLQIVDVTMGALLGKDGAQVSFVRDYDNKAGQLRVSLARLGKETGVDGSGILCTVVFKAVGAGSTDIVFSNNSVRDATSNTLPANFVPAKIQVQ